MRRYTAQLWTVLTALAWLAYFAITLGLPLQDGGPSLVTQAGSVIIGILLLLAVLLAGERAAWSGRLRLIILGAGVAGLAAAWLLNLNAPAYRGLLALALMAIALPVGHWVGNQLERVTNLIPVAVAFTFADIFSVFQGPSRQAVEDLQRHQETVADKVAEAIATAPPEEAVRAAQQAAAAIRAPLADYVIVQFPVPGTHASVPVLGVGDFVIMALLFRVAWVHGLSLRGILATGLASIIAALLVSGWLGAAIPALPFIAVGVVGYLLVTNPRLRRLDRQEVVLSIGVAVLFIALMAVRYTQAGL